MRNVREQELATLGSHTIIVALAPSESEAYGEYYHRPPAMVREDHPAPMVGAEGAPRREGGRIVNGDDGVPRVFRDEVEARRWLAEVS